MDHTFDEQYPNIAWWIQTDSGWIEIGSDEFSTLMILFLDVGGMLWQGENSYEMVEETKGDAFVKQCGVENGYASEQAVFKTAHVHRVNNPISGS